MRFTQDPKERPYGLEAVFHDLYGNHYALVERKTMPLRETRTSLARFENSWTNGAREIAVLGHEVAL